MAGKRRRKADLRITGLGDPEIIARLQKAAVAAGLQTVEELVDLVVDSGVSARPPKDYLTERFTLEDLGLTLWGKATSKPRPLRAQWYAGLAPVQKTAVVTVLKHRGYSSLTIANDFGIGEMEVEHVWADNRTSLGAQVLAVRLDTLVGQITACKQRAQEMALKQEDHKTLWSIEQDYTKLMQDLGVYDRAAHRVEVVNRAEETKAVQLKRLVDLVEKKANRKEELKLIEAHVLDSLPSDFEKEYDGLKDTD